MAHCIYVSPWSNTVTFGGFADEIVPVDIRHTGAGSCELHWFSFLCSLSSWSWDGCLVARLDSSHLCRNHASQRLFVEEAHTMAEVPCQELSWYSGGALRAETCTSAVRQFQLVGLGEDGLSIHVLRNARDVAVQLITPVLKKQNLTLKELPVLCH
eukprot:285636-Amphidinium_carterae.2